jgi:hypothetical protein
VWVGLPCPWVGCTVGPWPPVFGGPTGGLVGPVGSVGLVGGSEVGGSDVGGSDVGGSDVGGSEVGGSEVGGSEVGGSDVGGSDVGGSEVGGVSVGSDGIGEVSVGSGALADGLLEVPVPVGSVPVGLAEVPVGEIEVVDGDGVSAQAGALTPANCQSSAVAEAATAVRLPSRGAQPEFLTESDSNVPTVVRLCCTRMGCLPKWSANESLPRCRRHARPPSDKTPMPRRSETPLGPYRPAVGKVPVHHQ